MQKTLCTELATCLLILITSHGGLADRSSTAISAKVLDFTCDIFWNITDKFLLGRIYRHGLKRLRRLAIRKHARRFRLFSTLSSPVPVRWPHSTRQLRVCAQPTRLLAAPYIRRTRVKSKKFRRGIISSFVIGPKAIELL